MCISKKTEETVKISYASLIELFASANGFRTVFEKTANNLQDNIIDEFLIPCVVVNGVFAMELYLKWICAYYHWQVHQSKKENPEKETEFPRTHNLKQLFSKIDNYVENDGDKCLYKTDLIETMKKNGLNTNDISSFLSSQKNAFVSWRYSFSRCSDLQANLSIMNKILSSLQQYCEHLKHFYYLKEEWVEETQQKNIVLIISALTDGHEETNTSTEGVIK